MGWQKRKITSDELQDSTFNHACQEVGCTGWTELGCCIRRKVCLSKNLPQLGLDPLKEL